MKTRSRTEDEQKVIEDLISNLGSKNKSIRQKARDQILTKGKSAVRPLVKALSGSDARVRWEAGRLLDEIGAPWVRYADSNTINTLITGLCSKDGLIRVRARLALVTIGRKAVKALSDALQSKSDTCRWEAVKALGQISDAATVALLVKALEDEKFDVRWLAAEALINIGEPSLVPLLRELAKRPGAVWLREGVHHVLHGLAQRNIDTVVHPVLKALEDPYADLKVPFAAHNALKQLES